MILNTFFKKHNIVLDTEEKSMFGRRVSSCYRALYKEEVKFVSISENGIKMNVIDYSRSFFDTKQFKKIANRYFREKLIKVDNKIFKLK